MSQPLALARSAERARIVLQNVANVLHFEHPQPNKKARDLAQLSRVQDTTCVH